MTHPAASVYVDGVGNRPSKGGIRALWRDRVTVIASSLDEVRSMTTAAAKTFTIDGRAWTVDAADTTSVDDGVSVIVSADGWRYKPQTQRADALTLPRYADVPAGTLRQMLSVTTPKVVLAGDSLTTENPDQYGSSDVLWGRFRQTLDRALGSAGYSIVNRGVSGTTWFRLDSVPVSNFPSWYVDTGKAWLDYIKDEAPDLLVIGLGMNDDPVTPVSLTSVLFKISQWPKVPSVVLATNLVPSAHTGTPFTADNREARRKAAGYVRTFARTKPSGIDCGVLDFGALAHVLVHGTDPRVGHTILVDQAASKAIPYTCSRTGLDCDIQATWTGIDALGALFWDPSGGGTQRLKFQVSPTGWNGYATDVLLSRNGSGNLRVVVRQPGPYDYLTFDTAVAAPITGNVTVRITAKQSQIIVQLGGVEAFRANVPRLGGVFAPIIGYDGGATPSGAAATAAVTCLVDEPVVTGPALSDLELWGEFGDASPDYGGNGGNHMTTRAASYVYEPVLRAVDWRPHTWAPRERLAGNLTIYVRTDGSDTNSGRANTAAGAVATVARAFALIAALDINGFTVIIKLGNTGTFAAATSSIVPVGGSITIEGDLATPANTVLQGLTFSGIGRVAIKDLHITASGSFGIRAIRPGAQIELAGNVTFNTATSSHVRIESGAVVTVVGDYTIAGAAAYHVHAIEGGVFLQSGRTITVSGTPAFAGAFINIDTVSVFDSFSSSYSGAATGKRYQGTLNGVIQTYGGGASYFPGSVAGTTATGAQYA